MGRLRLHGARQQVGRVGFDHQPVGGDGPDQLAQVRAATLVAQPAGDADMPVLVEVVEQFLPAAGEAVHHRRPEPAIEVLHHRHEVGMRVALVQEQRLAGSPAASCGRRQNADVARAAAKSRKSIRAFAYRHHLRMRMQRFCRRCIPRCIRPRVRGARRRCRQFAGMLLRQRGAFGNARALFDHPRHAGITRAGAPRRDRGQAVVGEVAPMSMSCMVRFCRCRHIARWNRRRRHSPLRLRIRLRFAAARHPWRAQERPGPSRFHRWGFRRSSRHAFSIADWLPRSRPRCRGIRGWCWKRRPAPARPRKCRWRCWLPIGCRAQDRDAGTAPSPRARRRRLHGEATRREAVGDTVGYRIASRTRVGANTRIEVVTRHPHPLLQDDPLLEGVGALLFDEFHERHLAGDRPRRWRWTCRPACARTCASW